MEVYWLLAPWPLLNQNETHRVTGMAPTLHIRLLGNLLVSGDAPLTTINTPRLQSLLAYLVLHRAAPQPRRQVAFALWPDLPEARARANLRKFLLHLRQALPEAGRFLSIDNHVLQWRPEAPATLDVAEFEEQAATPAGWSQAAETYGGDLLPDCYDDWIVPERERLRQLYLEVLNHLIQQEGDAGNYDAALSYGRRLLQSDPLREEVYRELMRLQLLKDDRAAALRIYHTCSVTLRRELGVEPATATRELYERLVMGKAEEPAPVATAASSATLPLIGRAPEWAQLLDSWHAASTGHPRLILITGEAGIGKTRLAEEVEVWINRRGLATAAAHCYSAEGALPYTPVAEWLRARPLPRLDQVWLTEVARLLPELLARQPRLPAPGPLKEAWQLQRLHEALARAVLGGGTPLLLRIEDLQWCSRDTLEWLHYLLRFQPHARLLVLGTCRREGVGDRHPLREVLAGLRRGGQLDEIPLGPLDQAATIQLASSAAGQEMDAAAAATLYRKTEGNPLFVVEMVRAGWADRADTTMEALPSPVHSAITARLATLSPHATELAGVAATIGREFTLAMLRQVSRMEEEALVRALDELWQMRIVREQGESAYDFGHGLIREVVYAGLSAARRRLLHRRSAEALEAIYAGDLDSIAAQAAAHYDRAGLAEQAIQYYRRAADAAQRIYANDQAIAFLNRALELAPPSAMAERYDLLWRRAKIYDLQGIREHELQDITSLQALAQALQDPRRQGSALLFQARYADCISDYGGAIAAVQDAIRLCQLAQDISEEVAGYIQWGETLTQQGQLQEACTRLERALELARVAGKAELETKSLYMLAMVAAYQGDYTGARDFAEQIVGSGRPVEDKLTELLVLNILGIADTYLGNKAGARAQYERALYISREIGERNAESTILRNLASLAQFDGLYEEAQSYYEQSAQLCRATGSRRGTSETLAGLGLLFHEWGDEQAACKYSRQAARIAEQVGARYELGFALTILGHALASMGRLAESAEAYRRGLEARRAVGDLSAVAATLAALAGVLLAQGDPAQAQAHVAEALEYLAQLEPDNLDEPTAVYWDCYRVLHAAQDPRARDMLKIAYDCLQARLARIQDEATRQRVRDSYPKNLAVLEAWERLPASRNA